jgi:hypothetical protein
MIHAAGTGYMVHTGHLDLSCRVCRSRHSLQCLSVRLRTLPSPVFCRLGLISSTHAVRSVVCPLVVAQVLECARLAALAPALAVMASNSGPPWAALALAAAIHSGLCLASAGTLKLVVLDTAAALYAVSTCCPAAVSSTRRPTGCAAPMPSRRHLRSVRDSFRGCCEARRTTDGPLLAPVYEAHDATGAAAVPASGSRTIGRYGAAPHT